MTSIPEGHLLVFKSFGSDRNTPWATAQGTVQDGREKCRERAAIVQCFLLLGAGKQNYGIHRWRQHCRDIPGNIVLELTSRCLCPHRRQVRGGRLREGGWLWVPGKLRCFVIFNYFLHGVYSLMLALLSVSLC